MSTSISTDTTLSEALAAANTGNTRAVLLSPDLFAFVLSNFNNTVKLASGNSADLIIGLSNKVLTTGKLIGKVEHQRGITIGVTVAQMLMTTAGLVTLVGKGHGAATATIGAAFAKKTALAMGLAGNDDKQAKCIAALADLAASGLTVGVYAAASTTGIGAVWLAGGIAQLILSGYQAYQACLPAAK